MHDDRRAVRVGGLVLVAAVLAAASLLAVQGIQWRSKIRVRIYFEHVGALTEGHDVVIAGRRVGRVASVQLIPSGRDRPLLGGAGGVAIHATIEDRYRSMTSVNGEVFISSQGVLGKPYLAIGPPPADAPWERPLEDGDAVRGVDPARLDRVMRTSFENVAEIRALLAEAEPAARELGRELSALGDTLGAIEPDDGRYARTAGRMRAAGAELRAFGDALAAGAAGHEVPELVRRGRASLARASRELGGVADGWDALRRDAARVRGAVPNDPLGRVRRALDRTRAAVAQLEGAVAEVRELIALIERGGGGIGNLLNDPEFFDDAKQVRKKLLRSPWRFLGRPPERDGR